MTCQNEMVLKVQILGAGGKAPVCANPGSDLGYDLFCARGTIIYPGSPQKVYTQIAVELAGHGFLIRDRSSMASKGLFVTGGVIDAGYRGEVIVLLTSLHKEALPHYLAVGDKIAQLVPVPVSTVYPIEITTVLSDSARGADGFGSTGV